MIKLLTLIGALFGIVGSVQAQIASFKHVIIIFQENRTPDNLFQGLCKPPYGTADSCSPTATGKKYNIKTKDWLDKTSPTGVTQPLPVELKGGSYDLGHANTDWVVQCNKDESGNCRMDGSALVVCRPELSACPTQPQFRYAVSSDGVGLSPYLDLATQYGWANYMFQTNQGPSYPAHQIIFGATSGSSAEQDALGYFVSTNMIPKEKGAGCIADPEVFAKVIGPNGLEADRIRPCFERKTVSDLLSAHNPPITWRYYTPGTRGIWTAPNSIDHICQSSGKDCTGPDWLANIDPGNPSRVLTDIGSCNLREVSWIIPTGQNSDHAAAVPTRAGGPEWVASIVNAIGNSPCGYWQNTAIFITWDDWGGWYDHVKPTILPPPHGGYNFGFRVPLIVVSAYTPVKLVENRRHEFNSIVRFIEQNYKIGNLGLGDTRCDPTWISCKSDNLRAFFNYKQAPRDFKTIRTILDASFFINDATPPTAPDNDGDEE